MTRKKPAPQSPDLEKAVKALAESIADVQARLSVIEKTRQTQTWLQWLAGGSANEQR
jgi:hypothetical protein